MKVFVLMEHCAPESYGAWQTTILKIYTSKQSAEDHLRQLEEEDHVRYSIQEHLIKS